MVDRGKPMLIHFEPQDTLFFREARPMEAQGVKPLGGRFPPPARTVAGAVRALIGQAKDVDWERYRGKDRSGLEETDALIGLPDADPPGPLRLTGPFPTLDGERLYPVPLHLLRAKRKGGDGYDYGWLKPGPAVECDLGKVLLPVLDRRLKGAEPLEACWLRRWDFLRVLARQEPKSGGLIFTEPQETGDDEENWLMAGEPRLGIALDYPRRGAAEGQLYQTVQARLRPGVGVGVVVAHKDGATLPDLRGSRVRFGGEGRYAHIETEEGPLPPLQPEAPDPNRTPKGIVLVLLTPANFHPKRDAPEDDKPAWLLPGFTAEDRKNGAVWTGQIEGVDVDLVLVSAVTGKAIREGGWNLKAHAPRAAETLLPAGSVWFCETPDPVAAADKLTGMKLGEDTALGRGEIAVGYWYD